jgi:hypothetical protein
MTRQSALVSPQIGYGPLVGHSPEGYPVYLYTDPQTRLTCRVVVLPDGRAFYSDMNGRIVAKPVEANTQVGLALVGSIFGLILGGAGGAIIGALAGAVMGNQLSKKETEIVH